ncbi:MAG: MAPEG family protein, partial [Pseudomonadota bacterium]
RIHPQQVHSRAEMAARVHDSRAADHLSNLFELPVLFYAGCILIYLTGISDSLFLALAWLFVAFRFAQAVVHLTFNHVMTRLAFFTLGLLTFAVFWTKLIIDLVA